MKNKKIVIQRYLLLLCFCIFLFPPFQVNVTSLGGNADADDGGESTQAVVGGPTWDHTGWLVYIIDEAGNQLTDTKVFYSSSSEPPARCITYPTTKFGGSTNGYAGGSVADWEPKPPFDNGSGANGIAVKSYMLQNENLLRFIE